MNDLHQIPEYWFDGLRKFVNATYAYAANSGLQPFFPLDLHPYLYPLNSWQEKSLESLLKTSMKDLSPNKLKGQSTEYVWGYTFGMFESETPQEETEALEKFLPSTYIGEKIGEVNPEAAEKFETLLDNYVENFNPTQLKQFTQGKLDGLNSVYKDSGELKYESDRTDAYMLMLVMEQQLKFLDSWKSFHEFISTFIEGYRGEGRFASCKKMAQAVGFSPSKQVQKSCQLDGISSLH